jgi:hypothetical protein
MWPIAAVAAVRKTRRSEPVAANVLYVTRHLSGGMVYIIESCYWDRQLWARGETAGSVTDKTIAKFGCKVPSARTTSAFEFHQGPA